MVSARFSSSRCPTTRTPGGAIAAAHTFDPSHPDRLRILLNLGETVKEVGDIDESQVAKEIATHGNISLIRSPINFASLRRHFQ